MYNNIGKKIKGLAKGTFIAEAVAAIITGFILFVTGLDSWEHRDLALVGPLVIALGPIVAWVSSWLLYGFGELVDKTCDIERNTRGISSRETPSVNEIAPATSVTKSATVHSDSGWICDRCGTKNPLSSSSCKGCSSSKPSAPTLSKGVIPSSTEKPSVKCVCGERVYGEVCPNCGRKIELRSKD